MVVAEQAALMGVAEVVVVTSPTQMVKSIVNLCRTGNLGHVVVAAIYKPTTISVEFALKPPTVWTQSNGFVVKGYEHVLTISGRCL